MANIMGLNNNHEQFSDIKGQVFNKEGANLQQDILGKGSKTGVKTHSHYNILFNNLSDTNYNMENGLTSRNQEEGDFTKRQNALGTVIKVSGEHDSPNLNHITTEENNQSNSDNEDRSKTPLY